MSGISVEKYNETRLAVRGDRELYKDFMNKIGGRWNSKMKGGAGWLVPIKNSEFLDQLMNSSKTNDQDLDIDNEQNITSQPLVENLNKESPSDFMSRKDYVRNSIFFMNKDLDDPSEVIVDIDDIEPSSDDKVISNNNDVDERNTHYISLDTDNIDTISHRDYTSDRYDDDTDTNSEYEDQYIDNNSSYNSDEVDYRETNTEYSDDETSDDSEYRKIHMESNRIKKSMIKKITKDFNIIKRTNDINVVKRKYIEMYKEMIRTQILLIDSQQDMRLKKRDM